MPSGSERILDYYRGRSGHPGERPVPGWPTGLFNVLHGQGSPARVTQVTEGWEKALGQAANRVVDEVVHTQHEDSLRLQQLQKEVRLLKQQLHDARTCSTVIASLAPEPFVLNKSIPVLIRHEGDSYVATFVEANINASGDTLPNAVDNLKDVLVALFQRLSQEPKASLGKRPTKQLAILQEFLQEKE
jgi:hypothetical protein